jgi:hypothetical protein
MEWRFLAKYYVYWQQNNFQFFPINRTSLAIAFQEIPTLRAVVKPSKC